MSAAYMLIADIAEKDGVTPLNNLPGVWERKIDEHWTIAVNGHREEKKHKGVPVPPYCCYVEFNGWPAGLFTPYGGQFAAGDLANEDSFIKALEGVLGVPAHE